jgi:hypothetical protein
MGLFQTINDIQIDSPASVKKAAPSGQGAAVSSPWSESEVA